MNRSLIVALVLAVPALPARGFEDDLDELEVLKMQMRLEDAELRGLTIKLEVLGRERQTALIAGKSKPTELEHAMERLLSITHKSFAESDEVQKSRNALAAATLLRRAQIAEAAKAGKDVRTKSEKVQAEFRAACAKEESYVAACKALLAAAADREAAIKKAKEAGRDDRTEFEKAIETIDTATRDSAAYKAALKRWNEVRPGEPVPEDLDLPMASAPYKIALLKIKEDEKLRKQRNR